MEFQTVFNWAETVKFKADSPGVVVPNVILNSILKFIYILKFIEVKAF